MTGGSTAKVRSRSYDRLEGGVIPRLSSIFAEICYPTMISEQLHQRKGPFLHSNYRWSDSRVSTSNCIDVSNTCSVHNTYNTILNRSQVKVISTLLVRQRIARLNCSYLLSLTDNCVVVKRGYTRCLSYTHDAITRMILYKKEKSSAGFW
jgi:hypothetical protein